MEEIRKAIGELARQIQALKKRSDPIEQARPWSIEETARAMRCRRSDVERYLDTGELEFILQNGARYILQEDVRRLQRKRAKRKQPRRNGTPASARPDEIDPRLAKYFD